MPAAGANSDPRIQGLGLCGALQFITRALVDYIWQNVLSLMRNIKYNERRCYI